ncbi:MAG: hypothetical protein FJ112_02575 [Deltaproteobacteria bacterium]|nr:hypothetical protein [Deltaproteobacteria bacterium]
MVIMVKRVVTLFMVMLALSGCGASSAVNLYKVSEDLACSSQKPGRTFQEDCNTCMCDSSGRKVCTLMACR